MYRTARKSFRSPRLESARGHSLQPVSPERDRCVRCPYRRFSGRLCRVEERSSTILLVRDELLCQKPSCGNSPTSGRRDDDGRPGRRGVTENVAHRTPSVLEFVGHRDSRRKPTTLVVGGGRLKSGPPTNTPPRRGTPCTADERQPAVDAPAGRHNRQATEE